MQLKTIQVTHTHSEIFIKTALMITAMEHLIFLLKSSYQKYINKREKNKTKTIKKNIQYE